jgi:hypothetical protein
VNGESWIIKSGADGHVRSVMNLQISKKNAEKHGFFVFFEPNSGEKTTK